MTARVLFVDDEPGIRAGFRRLFGIDYHVDTAPGGVEGLACIAGSGPYSVVLSDMRMPGMSGIEFLARVREVSPQSVRMVLTGEADFTPALRALNEGTIFRLLFKPCAEHTLRTAIEAAQRQYELQRAEHALLDETLRATVAVLADVLSLADPATFGRSTRIRRYVGHIASALDLHEEAWQFDVAAMLSQIGCVTLPPRLLESMTAGDTLSESDRARYLMHATVALDLLAHVPRLQNVARMICRQHDGPTASLDDDIVALGAQVLKVSLAFDRSLSSGLDAEAALAALRAEPHQFSPRLVAALASVALDSMHRQSRTIPIGHLHPGMIVDQDVRTETGQLLVSRGQEVTVPMVVRLDGFRQSGFIGDSVRVLVPHPPA